VKVFFNGKYLVDFLDPLGSEQVKIEIKDGVSQMFLTATKDKVTSKGIIMPMRE
jgi:DNA polymerase III sliding clamp (beta) subunit (PCNA family)